MLTLLDLCSGIGGFSLAAQRAGIKTAAFSEPVNFCQRVIKKNFGAESIIYDYLSDITADTLAARGIGRIDILSAGFPCQPFSIAGQRAGQADDRYLWPQISRIISEIRPTWIVLENVTGIVKLALDDIIFDLESKGYSAQTFIIPALAVGAPHRRDRVWIVAADTSSNAQWRQQEQIAWGKDTLFAGQFSQQGVAANSDCNRQPQSCWPKPQERERACDCGEITGDPASPRLPERATGTFYQSKTEPQPERPGRRQAQPGVCRMDDGLPAWLDRASARAKNYWEENEAPAPTTIGKKGDDRRERLKALGNSVVSQIPQMIFEAIVAVEAATANNC